MSSIRLPAGVGLTALGAARGRATESARADRLFDDPYAADFVAAAGTAVSPAEAVASPTRVDLRPVIDAYVAVRTRFFDDALLEAARAGIHQMVVLGAGLDARAFRLPWPAGVRLFEVDVADMFEFKEPILQAGGAAARCQRVVVAADLRNDWPAAIRASGYSYNRDRPTAWLLEGLLMYLTAAERDRLLERIGRLSAPESQLVLEPAGWTIPHALAPTVAFGQADQAVVQQIVAAGETAVAEDSVGHPARWLAGHGWQAQLYAGADQFTAYGRPVPPLLNRLRRYLATAQRS
jgi:methyltransferase (TIGR00027 family)